MKSKQVLLNDTDKNYEIHVLDDGRIAYLFDPKKVGAVSKSGKSVIISSTHGSVQVTASGVAVTISMNAYKKA